MPLIKVLPKSGVDRENTRYTNEGRWYESEKIRFRQGTPEKIGGWVRISADTFKGVCRSLWNWVTLSGVNYLGLGTNLKFYLETGGAYSDITPIRAANTLINPFATTSGSPIVTVTDSAGGFIDGDYVAFYPSTTFNGITLYGEYELTRISSTTYAVTASSNASSTGTGGGTVQAVYEINTGPVAVVPRVGWGASGWGSGAWSIGASSSDALRIWSQSNFGEDLIFGPRGGGIYYWPAGFGFTPSVATFTVASPTVVTVSAPVTEGVPVRFVPDAGAAVPTGITAGQEYFVRNPVGNTFNISATPSGALINVAGAGTGTTRLMVNGYALADVASATDVPIQQNYLLVSDISRFVFAFGCNDFGSTTVDPMLVRWSDQEDPTNWTPSATNQAGFLRLSRGSQIITALQARQEVLVWTDSSLYSFQYQGAPTVWGAQLVGDNISIASQNAVSYAEGVAFWMGKDKFYRYDGTTKTLRCDLRKFVFENLNTLQFGQVFSGTNEAFNEVWWFYCSKDSSAIDSYVIYNYAEDVWYYGTMARTAWLDSGLRDSPIAATYLNNLVDHETGVDDVSTGVALPINAYVTSAEFDLDDGHNFMFVWRVLPDITFAGSTGDSPSVMMYLLPLQNSGSGYTGDAAPDGNHSIANQSYAQITRVATLPIEQFTGQIFTRVRGRQMAIKVESTDLGVNWQLGSPRLDAKPDGRR